MEGLELVRSVDPPSTIGSPCTFRSVRFVRPVSAASNVLSRSFPRYHPSDDGVLYTVINTSPPRERGRKTPLRQGYISRWNTQTWTTEKQKKVGDKGLTAFDIRYGNLGPVRRVTNIPQPGWSVLGLRFVRSIDRHAGYQNPQRAPSFPLSSFSTK